MPQQQRSSNSNSSSTFDGMLIGQTPSPAAETSEDTGVASSDSSASARAALGRACHEAASWCENCGQPTSERYRRYSPKYGSLSLRSCRGLYFEVIGSFVFIRNGYRDDKCNKLAEEV
ncbi:hypothetical protein GQ42DRAFT_156041 [Ramicandelaber brevisporus]|nr:hypothetical protein GQ42DRAFT_156041 [Ramicandelaber brevisporus]